MLPLIRMGSTNLKLYNEAIYKNSTEAVDAMARFGDAFDRWIQNLKNRSLELLGTVLNKAENGWIESSAKSAGAMVNVRSKGDEVPGEKGKSLQEISDISAKWLMEEIGPGFTDEKRMVYGKLAASQIENEDARKMFMDSFSKLLDQPGKKLSPFGFTEAGAASQMQQMGGGDIFGAVGFSPLERIATATEDTANTLEAMLQMETGTNPIDINAR
jgi:hypothetical protein